MAKLFWRVNETLKFSLLSGSKKKSLHPPKFETPLLCSHHKSLGMTGNENEKDLEIFLKVIKIFNTN